MQKEIDWDKYTYTKKYANGTKKRKLISTKRCCYFHTVFYDLMRKENKTLNEILQEYFKLQLPEGCKISKSQRKWPFDPVKYKKNKKKKER